MVHEAHELNYRKTKKVRSLSLFRAQRSHTRVAQRVIEAIASVLGPAENLAHEALSVGVDLLQFAPVPALDVVGQILLNIWDSVEMIEVRWCCNIRRSERFMLNTSIGQPRGMFTPDRAMCRATSSDPRRSRFIRGWPCCRAARTGGAVA